MKKFLLTSAANKADEILKTFLRKKSLFQLRAELRGRMGLPRMRSNDDSFVSNASRIGNSRPPTKKNKNKSMVINIEEVNGSDRRNLPIPLVSPTKSVASVRMAGDRNGFSPVNRKK